MECIKLFGVFIPKPPSTTLPSNLHAGHYDQQELPLTAAVPTIETRLENPVEQPASSSSPPPESVLNVMPKNKKMIKRPRLRAPHPQDLPQIYCDFFINKGLYVNSLRPIFTRRLNVTDMSHRHKRLSMPCKQIREGFLTPGEEDLIRKGFKKGNRPLKEKIDVVVVDPSLNIRPMKLARWNYGVDDNNENKKKSWWYALMNDWNKLAKDNGLAVGDAIQVWSFRTKGGHLGFIIHKIDRSACV